MSDDPGPKSDDDRAALADVHPADEALTETSSTRRAALGVTAAATAAFLADRAILTPGSARAESKIVESVNGKSGVVTLKAAEVGAIPEEEAGKANGVATLNSSGQLIASQIPSSVVSNKEKPLGEVSGTVKINLSETYEGALPNYLTMTATGALTIEIENCPPGIQTPLLKVVQDRKGGHSIEVVGAVGEPATPAFDTEPNAVNFIPLFTDNEAKDLYILTGPEPKTGAWLTLEGLSEKLKIVEAENPKAQVRSEWGAKAYLQGDLEAKEEISPGSTLFKVPTGCKPPEGVVVLNGATVGSSLTSTGTPITLRVIKAGGVLTSEKIKAGQVLHLNNLSWSLT